MNTLYCFKAWSRELVPNDIDDADRFSEEVCCFIAEYCFNVAGPGPTVAEEPNLEACANGAFADVLVCLKANVCRPNDDVCFSVGHRKSDPPFSKLTSGILAILLTQGCNRPVNFNVGLLLTVLLSVIEFECDL